MTQSKSSDPQPPAKITEVIYEPTSTNAAPQRDQRDGPFWDNGDDAHTLRPVSFSGRMFNVGWKGWVRLALICIFVGAVFQAGAFNPFAPGFTIGAGAGQILDGLIKIATWAAQLAALPLLLGAVVVLPFWLLWRAVLALFNKDKPPGPHDRILPKERAKRR
ncbi:MAG: hypothetical protein Q8R82_05495 [Hyphomonadaceae bacterium]|nr:hypothetical protein [Hyphomonadaceae bacterium]